jgi:signal transduction histidine kinase
LKLRSRILLASSLLIATPLLVLAFGVRSQMAAKLSAQYNRRIETLMSIISEDLNVRGQGLAARLHALRNQIADDNTFRLAVLHGRSDLRPDLLDYAGKAMTLMGLDMLQVQDAQGRILSSGHFRNEFDRLQPHLPRLLGEKPDGSALVWARQPGSPFWALARVDSFRLGGHLFHLVGGLRVDGRFLASLTRDRAVAVSLVYPGGALSTDPALQQALEPLGRDRLEKPEIRLSSRRYLVRARDLPLIPADAGWHQPPAGARLIVSHPLSPLKALLRSLDLWLALVMLATLAGTLILAAWLSALISRPLAALAQKTASLDLDRLDADFPADRQDEVGVLSRFLAAMTARLRSSLVRMREAERQATLGELARQVNHDIRNGLTPLRNVVRHLSEVATKQPAELAQVFQERKGTIVSGLTYLEELAANYARLTPLQRRQSCSVNDVVRQVLSHQPMLPQVDYSLRLAPDSPVVLADPVGLRRIVENLLSNARESLPAGKGAVAVETAIGQDGQVLLKVSDTGSGIPATMRERIFQDFYTTKEHGTGLGLSIVRRLVADYEGSITVASPPGGGTTFTLSFPAMTSTGQTPEAETSGSSPSSASPGDTITKERRR